MSEVQVTCLCSKVSCVVQLVDSIPATSRICHRASCRYNLGAICHSALAIKARPEVVDELRSYTVDNSLKRYFCSTCGSHMFEEDGTWNVQSGVIEGTHSEQVFDALEDVVGHRFVQETLDGGLSLCLTGSDPESSKVPLQPASSVKDEDERSQPKPIKSSGESNATLEASCICGGVKFSLQRPSAESRQCSSPWPDLIIPYYLKSTENPNDIKWWIRENGKWLAGTCACRSCRLGLGSPIQAWTFVSRRDILQPDGSSLCYNLGSLQCFESSPGAMREFCSICGATAFWHCLERPDVVDVSVGLLKAPEGVMARSWLDWWTDRVSFAEDAVDKRLITTLEARLPLLKDAMPQR